MEFSDLTQSIFVSRNSKEVSVPYIQGLVIGSSVGSGQYTYTRFTFIPMDVENAVKEYTSDELHDNSIVGSDKKSLLVPIYKNCFVEEGQTKAVRLRLTENAKNEELKITDKDVRHIRSHQIIGITINGEYNFEPFSYVKIYDLTGKKDFLVKEKKKTEETTIYYNAKLIKKLTPILLSDEERRKRPKKMQIKLETQDDFNIDLVLDIISKTDNYFKKIQDAVKNNTCVGFYITGENRITRIIDKTSKKTTFYRTITSICEYGKTPSCVDSFFRIMLENVEFLDKKQKCCLPSFSFKGIIIETDENEKTFTKAEISSAIWRDDANKILGVGNTGDYNALIKLNQPEGLIFCSPDSKNTTLQIDDAMECYDDIKDKSSKIAKLLDEDTPIVRGKVLGASMKVDGSKFFLKKYLMEYGLLWGVDPLKIMVLLSEYHQLFNQRERDVSQNKKLFIVSGNVDNLPFDDMKCDNPLNGSETNDPNKPHFTKVINLKDLGSLNNLSKIRDGTNDKKWECRVLLGIEGLNGFTETEFFEFFEKPVLQDLTIYNIIHQNANISNLQDGERNQLIYNNILLILLISYNRFRNKIKERDFIKGTIYIDKYTEFVKASLRTIATQLNVEFNFPDEKLFNNQEKLGNFMFVPYLIQVQTQAKREREEPNTKVNGNFKKTTKLVKTVPDESGNVSSDSDSNIGNTLSTNTTETNVSNGSEEEDREED